MPEPLTELERGILEYLVGYLRENTYQPSIREIGRQFNIKSTKTVSEHLQALADKGWIERDPSRSRGVRILGLNLHGPEAPSGPVEVASGTHVLVPESLAAARPQTRMVRLTAPGPAETPLQPGDEVAVEPVEERALRAGDLLVARLNADVAIGVCRQQGSSLVLEWRGAMTLTLRPERARGLEILGRPVGFWRALPAAAKTKPQAPSASS